MSSSMRIAQANPSNGASNASDFQPPTGNPQTVPGEIFPSSPSLQESTSEELLQNGQATISVPDGSGDSASSGPHLASDGGAGVLVLMLVAFLGVLLLYTILRLSRRLKPDIAPLEATLKEFEDKPAAKKRKSKKRTGQNKRRK